MSKDFASALKAVRKKSGLSQVRTAELSGLSVAVIKQCESGRHAPSLPTLEALASLFHVSMDALWRGRCTQKPADQMLKDRGFQRIDLQSDRRVYYRAEDYCRLEFTRKCVSCTQFGEPMPLMMDDVLAAAALIQEEGGNG